MAPAEGPLARMPVLGFGVGTAWFKAGDEKPLQAALGMALQKGFRHLDDAEMYQNGSIFGAALQEWLGKGNKREDLWITNKVADLDKPIAETTARLLKDSTAGYFDLLLLHSPCRLDGNAFKKPLEEAWRELMAVYKAGSARAIGVSNFRVEDLERIFALQAEEGFVPPCCNQIEANPFLQQPALLEYCHKKNITVTCYGPQLPLTKGLIAGTPVEAAVEVATKRTGKNQGQVLLRWALQTGRLPITTTGKPERADEYLAILEFELTAEEVEGITQAGLRQPQKRVYWIQCKDFFEESPAI